MSWRELTVHGVHTQYLWEHVANHLCILGRLGQQIHVGMDRVQSSLEVNFCCVWGALRIMYGHSSCVVRSQE